MSEWDFGAWQQMRLDEFECALEQALDLQAPANLLEPMRYAALGGGKRVRPLLTLAACEAVSGVPSDQQSPKLREAVLRAAAAVECVHVYSLIHDDLPCMDDDDMRRGRATTHVKYGEAQALLAGDALQTLAFELLSGKAGMEANVQLQWCQTLARAAGASGMCAGQALDIGSVGVDLNQAQLEAMHAAKTGALITCALALGAQAALANDAQLVTLDAFGKCIGLAFQVVDDVLDVTADSQVLGKTAGKDAANDKPTYVALMGLQGAKQYAIDLHGKANQLLDDSGLQETRALRALAERVVARTY